MVKALEQSHKLCAANTAGTPIPTITDFVECAGNILKNAR